MKKSVFLAVLGVAASLTSSFGQGTVGTVNFTSYFANGGAGATTTIFGSSTLVGSTYHADLYYFIGTIVDPVVNSSAISISSAPTGLTAANVPTSTAGDAFSAGYFGNPIIPVTIPGYSSGPVTFEVVAYNGADFATSSIRGRSGAFTMSSIATPGNPVPVLNGLPNFFVAPVPEPTTMALVGLGGLALVAFRRKQS